MNAAMNAPMKTVLVTGATGNVGRTVVAALRARRTPVRALVRDEAKARRLLGADVDLAHGDFADPVSLRCALRGVDAVFLTSADGPDKVAHENAVIDAASTAWIKRIVKLSSPHVEIGSEPAFWDWHARIEQHLHTSGVPSVRLRSNYLMSNLLAAADAVAGTGQLFAPAGDARIAMIDPADIGATAAVLLTEDGHDGRTYELTGPAALSYHDIAAELSAVTGRKISYVDIPDDTARAVLAASGAPDWLVTNLVTMFGKLRNGAGAHITDTVRELTGCQPRPLGQWLHNHAQAFTTSRPHPAKA
ncbi:SDR family oxidoreductase [Streptomyces sp. NL15-2K]|uniref:SDR family oxidoreductase n=1 Tax=Streptomyces sp. NL15-2K TaxID=376149 RepID=UPI000F5809D3|nr:MULTISPECIES: SDR family oxidoreductase [Actinomycetes]WKX06230.1 SDR family oxidoreductase [Kutzneria buriramensis]GCB52912.1 oxidoreductase [Streptomyces sp. NL15-2K]